MTKAMLPEITAATAPSEGTFHRLSMHLERRMDTCPKHGAFESAGAVLGGQIRWSICPVCRQEREESELKSRQQNTRKEASMESMERLFSSCGVPARYHGASFETYTLFPANHQWHALQSEALKTCQDYTKNFSAVLKHGGNLILRGNSGTGKTHLACSIVAGVIRQGYSAQFTSTSAIVRAVKSGQSYSAEMKSDEVINRLSMVDLLVIDEFEEFVGEEARHILIDVVNARYSAKKPLIVITNLTADELTKLVAARTVDRLRENGFALSFPWESFRQKVTTLPVWRNSSAA